MITAIQCDNPECNANITVPEGASYVSCPNCQKYHFASDFPKLAQGGPQPTSDPAPSGWPPPNYEDNAPVAPAPLYPSTPNNPWVEEQPTWVKPKEAPRPPDNMPVAFLVKYNGDQLPLKVGPNHIGRKEGDLLINDIKISRKHCIIEVSPRPMGGGWQFMISDIGRETGVASTNGVFIDNRSIRLENYESVPLNHGTTIQLGETRLLLQIK